MQNTERANHSLGVKRFVIKGFLVTPTCMYNMDTGRSIVISKSEGYQLRKRGYYELEESSQGLKISKFILF